jgi:predicted DNA-binding transcriptional regulator AlpA
MRSVNITPPTPRLLSAELAAAYLSISPRGFEKLWRTGHLPAPHRLGRRVLWDRKLLDQFVDILSSLHIPPDEIDEWAEIGR